MISQNQQAFIDVLNEREGQGEGVAAGGGAAGQVPPGAAGQVPPGAAGMPMTIQVTAQEKEAIERVRLPIVSCSGLK